MDRVEFEGHPLWAAVDELGDLLVRADEAAEPAHYRTLDQLRYEQLRYVIRRIRSRRPPPEATEAARTKLDRLHGQAQAASAELSAFLSDGGGAHLTVAVGLVDWALLDLGVRGRSSRPHTASRRPAVKPKPRPAPKPPPKAEPTPWPRVAAGRPAPPAGKPAPAAGRPAPAAGRPAPALDSTPTIRLGRPRHARRAYDRALVFGIGVVAVLAAAIGSVLASGSAGGAPGATGKGVSAACTVLRVVTASSYQPALDAVADDLAHGDECVYLDLTVADGSDAARVVDEEHAQVWIADAAGWLSEAGVDGSRSQTLATSPVLFASSGAVAAAVHRAGGGWSGLANLIDSGSSVRIVTAAPAESGDGMVALAGLGDAARGAPGLDAALVLDRAHRHHRSTQQLVGSGIGADEIALVPEHLLGDAAAAQGVITVPRDRTVLMRYSWYSTDVDADATAINAARERLLDVLTQGATAEEARVAAHLRDAQGRPPANDPLGVWGHQHLPPANTALDAHRVDRVMATWYAEDRRADLLVVVDVSAGMAASAPGSRWPLIALVRHNLLRLAARMPDDARLGVWAFGSQLGGARDYGVVDSMRPLTMAHRSSLDATLDRLVARDTSDGFYNAVLAAYRSAASHRWPDVDCRVMVLTAGSHANDPGSLSAGELHRGLARVARADRPVELTIVKVGRGPTATLDRAVRPVGGKVETVGGAEGVVAAFVRLAVGDLHR